MGADVERMASAHRKAFEAIKAGPGDQQVGWTLALVDLQPADGGEGTWNPSVIREAESRTFATFGAMLGLLVLKTLRE